MNVKSAQKIIFATSGLCGLYFVDQNHFTNNETIEAIEQNINITNCDNTTSSNPNDKSVRAIQEQHLQKATNITKSLVDTKMCQSAIPGLIIGVSVNGKTVFRKGTF